MRKHYKAHTTVEVEAYERAIADSLLDGQQQPINLEGQRVLLACTACATSKTKCDQQIPCSRCKTKGLTCTSRTKRRVWDGAETSIQSEATASVRHAEDRHEGVLEETTPLVDNHFQETDLPQAPLIDNNVASSPLDSVAISQPSSARDGLRTTEPAFAGQGRSQHLIQGNRFAEGADAIEKIREPFIDGLDFGALRTHEVPLLPQLAWQSLANTPRPDQSTLSGDLLTDVNGFGGLQGSAPHSHAFNTLTEGSGSLPEQFMQNNDSLFSFNFEEFSWQSQLSALDSVMADCFRSPESR